MPIYEFKCEKCGRIFEEITDSETKEMDCPCGQGKALRMMSSFSLGGKATPQCGVDCGSCEQSESEATSTGSCGCGCGGSHSHASCIGDSVAQKYLK